MVILVDMDGTIADFNTEYRRRITLHFPELSLTPYEAQTSQYLDSTYPPELQKNLRAVYHEPGFFESLLPIEGSLSALHALRDQGHDVVICTSPSLSAPWCESEKRHWVTAHLDEAFARTMVITKDKTLIRGDILIDDRPHVTGKLSPSWQQVIFDAPYNRDAIGPRIASDWHNWDLISTL